MAMTTKALGDLALKVLVGILFVVIGIQGIGDFGGNALYDELDSEMEIIVGIVLLVAGLLLIVPSFIGGIKQNFTRVSTLIVLIAWVLFIILTDFVYGFSRFDGERWILWIEDFVMHLLILACIMRVASPAVKKIVK